MNSFFSGSLEPFLPHVMLLSVAIAASFAVAIGIVLENPKWSLANVLVVGGVALEAVCTLLLFGFDEGISTAQQAKIITLENRLAARSLSDEQVAKLKESLSEFREQHFQLFSYRYKESSDIAAQLGSVAIAAGWVQDPIKSNTFLMNVLGGISINTDDAAPGPVKAAASKIVSALKDGKIDVSEDHRSNPTDIAVIGIAVGIKP